MTVIGIFLLIVVAIVVIIAFGMIGIYNSLVKGRNRVDEAEADIDVQLKRRYDLIPNLVETVKGYAAHERGVFEKVTEARASAMGGGTMREKAGKENMLTDALKTLFAVAENYPDLKANQNFLALQEELTDTENKIEAARRFFNGLVRDFNIKIQVFPNTLVAGMLGFTSREMFEIEEAEEREPVEVKF
ncbi:MAG: LemA family protein [Actinomycetota bacterium]